MFNKGVALIVVLVACRPEGSACLECRDGQPVVEVPGPEDELVGDHDQVPPSSDKGHSCTSGTPLERATRTGELIGNVTYEVVRKIVIEGQDQEEVWTNAFGGFVSTSPTADGIRFDDAFEIGPREAYSLQYSKALDGLPVVELWYPIGRGGFFYELTILDPYTGAIYQGDNYEGINLPIGRWRFRGPLLPAEDARVTRNDVESIDQIGRVIHDVARDTWEARCAEESFASECLLW